MASRRWSCEAGEGSLNSGQLHAALAVSENQCPAVPCKLAPSDATQRWVGISTLEHVSLRPKPFILFFFLCLLRGCARATQWSIRCTHTRSQIHFHPHEPTCIHARSQLLCNRRASRSTRSAFSLPVMRHNLQTRMLVTPFAPSKAAKCEALTRVARAAVGQTCSREHATRTGCSGSDTGLAP